MISEKNFLQRALRCYDNPQCITLDEFQEDLNRFSHIKKIITKYAEGQGEINDRLVLNHLVTLFNVFGLDALLFVLFKIEEKHWGIIFPFLILLNKLPDYIPELKLTTADIELDKNIIEKLRQI